MLSQTTLQQQQQETNKQTKKTYKFNVDLMRFQIRFLILA